MAINQFNRTNPLIISMRNQNDLLTNESFHAVKRVLGFTAIQIILGILVSVGGGYLYYAGKVSLDYLAKCIAISAILILGFLFVSRNFISSFKNPHMDKINEMIYGHVYEILNVNNEDVIEIINDINFVRGRLGIAQTLYPMACAIVDGIVLISLF